MPSFRPHLLRRSRGLPSLAQRLSLREHAALRTRIVSPNVLRPRDRDTFFPMLEHGLKTAGATSKLLSDPALEVIWRVSQGVPAPRVACSEARSCSPTTATSASSTSTSSSMRATSSCSNGRASNRARASHGTNAGRSPVDRAGWYRRPAPRSTIHDQYRRYPPVQFGSMAWMSPTTAGSSRPRFPGLARAILGFLRRGSGHR